jgi:hypothetical protein
MQHRIEGELEITRLEFHAPARWRMAGNHPGVI